MVTRRLLLLTALILCADTPGSASGGSGRGASAEALQVARESAGRLSLGRLTVKEKGTRPPRVRAELLFNGVVVARLRVNPRTGDFTGKEERTEGSGQALDLPTLRAAVERALRRLEIGEWTWPTEHGRAWGVPLKYGGRAVGTIKVGAQKGPLPKKDDD